MTSSINRTELIILFFKNSIIAGMYIIGGTYAIHKLTSQITQKEESLAMYVFRFILVLIWVLSSQLFFSYIEINLGIGSIIVIFLIVFYSIPTSITNIKYKIAISKINKETEKVKNLHVSITYTFVVVGKKEEISNKVLEDTATIKEITQSKKPYFSSWIKLTDPNEAIATIDCQVKYKNNKIALEKIIELINKNKNTYSISEYNKLEIENELNIQIKDIHNKKKLKELLKEEILVIEEILKKTNLDENEYFKIDDNKRNIIIVYYTKRIEKEIVKIKISDILKKHSNIQNWTFKQRFT